MQKIHHTVALTGHQRVNVSLSKETLALLDRITKKGERSAVLDKAVNFYVKKVGASNLERELIKGYKARAKQDRTLAEEWFNLADDAWPE